MTATSSSIRELYDQILLPELQALERIRKDQLNRQIFIIIALLAAVLIGLILLIPFLILVTLVVALGVYFIMFGFNRKRFDFKSEYKSRIIRKMTEHLYPGLTYDPHKFVPQREYEKSRIFVQSPDIYSGEDYFSGQVGATRIVFSEIHSQDRHRDSNGNTRYTTIFKGLFLIADFNKNFEASTYVLSDFGERFMGFFGQLFQHLNIMRPALVTLEDPAFEKYFAVYSTNETEARYILTPVFMEKLLAFRKRTGAQIQCSFVDAQLFFALPINEKMFEPSLYRSVVNFNDIEEFRKELDLCVSLVEDLNLNTRIWTKE